jgi:hypothetical protein
MFRTPRFRTPRWTVTEITEPMNAFVVPTTTHSEESATCCFAKRMTNMTETRNQVLTDAELDGVVGGLNPQPLPPSPPPPPQEGIQHSLAIAASNRF